MADRTCSIDGCARALKARGWCATHYQRFRTTGTVELLPEPKRPCRGEECPTLVGTYRNGSGLCKSCYRKRHYQNNREHELAGMARWREQNREYDRERWRTRRTMRRFSQ